MYMILFVLHDPALLKDLLNVWHETGVSGITILPSTGLKRLSETAALRDDLPLIPSLEDLIDHEGSLNRTLFTIVPNDAMVDKVLTATQELIGDLNLPNTGIMAVLPLARVHGLDRKDNLQDEDSYR
jgi:hypothetical protein